MGLDVDKIANSISVETNEYAQGFGGVLFRSYNADNIQIVDEHADHVYVYMGQTNDEFMLTNDANYQGSDFMIVSTINDVAPSSLHDLYLKISELR